MNGLKGTVSFELPKSILLPPQKRYPILYFVQLIYYSALWNTWFWFFYNIKQTNVCVCVCVCVHVYVVYEDTNLYNDMGMT